MSEYSWYQTEANKELLEGWVNFLNNVNFHKSSFNAKDIQFLNNFNELVRRVEMEAIETIREN